MTQKFLTFPSFPSPLPENQGGTGNGTYSIGNILYASATTTLNKLAIGNNGTFLKVVAGVPAWATGVMDYNNMMYIREQQPSGTQGGANVAGAWTNRILNTVVINNITGASLASNVITLPAGTYLFMTASNFGYGVQGYRTRLFNNTDSTISAISASGYANSTQAISTVSHIYGFATYAASKNIILQYRANFAQGSFGLGYSSTSGDDEIYSNVYIFKVA